MAALKPKLAGRVVERDAGFVARRLDPQYAHRRTIPVACPQLAPAAILTDCHRPMLAKER
jgi:hypothetical protein